ncbi:MAG TPA: acetate kinase, partial [Erysipelothrix sp.]|nr:acetate kinase [Erysipelothrix sp.]
HRAILAQKLFANRVAAYVGEYFVQMGRVDGIVFTGGIGENDVVMRELILERIKDALQITYDASLNASVRSKEVKLTLEDSKVDVWLVPTDEEIVLARDAYANL